MFENKENVTIIKIDPWSIVKIVLIFIGLGFLFAIRDVLLIIFMAIILASVIGPAVNFFERKKMPRWLGALIIYLVIFVILAGIGFVVGPTIVQQTKLFVGTLVDFFSSKFSQMTFESRGEFLQLLNSWLSKSSLSGSSIFLLVGTVAGQITSFFMVLVVAYYLSVEKQIVQMFVNSLVPARYRDFVKNFITSSQREIGAWARAALFLCLTVGILTYLGLLILKIKYPLTLAVIAGLTEIIPWLGPWLGAIPAVIFGFIQSPSLGLLVILLYVVVQQIENSLIVPHVMHKVVGLNPLIVILAILIGGSLAGPIGMLLSVPITTVIAILIRDYLALKEKKEIV